MNSGYPLTAREVRVLISHILRYRPKQRNTAFSSSQGIGLCASVFGGLDVSPRRPRFAARISSLRLRVGPVELLAEERRGNIARGKRLFAHHRTESKGIQRKFVARNFVRIIMAPTLRWRGIEKGRGTRGEPRGRWGGTGPPSSSSHPTQQP